MQLKHILLSIGLVIFALIVIFIIKGMIPHKAPPGLNLSVSEALSPGVSVVVLNGDKKSVTSIDMNEHFYLQQKGLAEETTYGFRVIDSLGRVTMPVYETFTAKDPSSNWIESNKYYNNLAIANFTIELLVIQDDTGNIVARTNLTIFSLYQRRAELENLVRDNCSSLLAEPLVDKDGWSRSGKLARCAAGVGAKQKDTFACNLIIKLFNSTDLDECFTTYAILTGDTSACDKAGMPKSRGFCKAKATKDWTECRKVSCDASCAMESLETQQDLCVQWYAIENRNASLCNEIKSEAYGMKGICLNITAQR